MKRTLEISSLIIISILIIIAYEFVPIEKRSLNPYANSKIETSPEPVFKYGIVVDSMLIFQGKVKRNEFLSDILLRYNVDYSKIDILAKRSKNVFDVRKIRRGFNYSVLCTNDSLKNVLYFVYESSPVNYVVFDLGDSVHVHTGKKDIERRIAKSSGIIESSLWNSMIDNGSNPNLANDLSEIFAWTIDFFDIKKGDYYKVIYENLYVDDDNIGIGNVLGAMFHHLGEDYYSYYFIRDNVGDYFDDEGGSMRRTFLKAPLRFKRISSRYSLNRMHPILKYRRPHRGIDYAAAIGTPVHTIGDGKVTRVRWTRQGGRTVKIKHNGTYSTAYLHLSGYGKGIKKGAQVKQGDIIGYVGKSGLATGSHLDFRFYRNGKAIDPLKVKSPPANPVDSANMQEFDSLRLSINEQLRSIVLDTITISK